MAAAKSTTKLYYAWALHQVRYELYVLHSYGVPMTDDEIIRQLKGSADFKWHMSDQKLPRESILENIAASRIAGIESTERELAAANRRIAEPTDAQCDAVRGILQSIRCNPGVTLDKVMEHCKLRGDDLTKWPQWARNSKSYATESACASLIYSVMIAALEGGRDVKS